MDIFEDLDIFAELDQSRRTISNIPMRCLRDADDPYKMDRSSFIKRYRFSQDTVKNIIYPMLSPHQPVGSRGSPIPLELQILACLRFYATASFQIVTGDLLHISQPAVSRIVAKLSHQLAEQHGQYIKYPVNIASNRLKFCRLGQYRQFEGLPNVDGAIDCTHIKIVDTPGVQHHEVFRNRKSYFSLNVQAVVGPNGEFMDVVARWAGSTHDSRIFQMSRINSKYREHVHDGYLVGDSGYPCLPYLITPIGNPVSSAEERFNIAQRKTRNIIERTFGIWKRRFPCLRRGLGNKLPTVTAIIVACAVLHNIAVLANEEMPADQNAEDIEEQETYPHNPSGTADGFAVRASLIERFI